jgi:hypothetical protein
MLNAFLKQHFYAAKLIKKKKWILKIKIYLKAFIML